MIDSSYLDCVIASKVHNAFRRNENNNHVLYVPKGKSYDDVLVVNEIGEQILQLAKNECTVREVIEQIHNDNPEIAYTKVEEDTYRFLQSAVGVNIIRIKGIENNSFKIF